MSALREAAFAYLRLGLHPIPCVPRSKRPLVEWRRYQTDPPLEDELDAWWAQWPDANVALVLGRGTFAVDLDGGDDAQDLLVQRGVLLPGAPRSKTANGYHVFLAAPGPIPDRVGLLTTRGTKPQVDIRGVGYVVAPPSIHPAGPVYEWQVPFTLPLPPAPPELLRLIERGDPLPPPELTGAPGGVGGSWVLEALRGVGIGTRDQTCTRLAGFFLGHGLDVPLTEAILGATFAVACAPRFPAEDVRKCVRSIDRRRALEQARDRPGLEPVHLAGVLGALARQALGGGPALIATPFAKLTHTLDGGLAPGDLIYLGARPGVGKTALGLHIAEDAAQAGARVLVVSREMRNLALARRMLAQASQVSASQIKRWDFPDLETRAAIDTALTRLRQLPVWLTDQALSIGEVSGLITAADPPYHLLIVDYLQLVTAPPEIRERRLQVEAVSQGLKALAMTAALPVLCLSSLARPPRTAKGGEPTPTLADLRESGELEHDADIVLFLHRTMLATTAELLVAKNRDGAVGRIALTFRPDTLTFLEAARA